MSDVTITVELPEELIQRAQTAGLKLDTAQLTAMIETELARMQAADFLINAARKLEGSLSPEEIEYELAAAKAERIEQDGQNTEHP